jgi:hypothetical protein
VAYHLRILADFSLSSVSSPGAPVIFVPTGFESAEVNRCQMKQQSLTMGLDVFLPALSMQAISSFADEKWQHPPFHAFLTQLRWEGL